MPTVIHMTVDIRVPVDPKDAIDQMVVTQALDTAANALRIVSRERDGQCIIMAAVRKVKAVPVPAPPGDTPETMPVSLA